MLSNILNIYCKNIFNNFLIAESCCTRTHLFQKLPSPAPAPAPTPESRNAPVLHRQGDTHMHKMQSLQLFSCITLLLLYCNLSISAFLCELNEANPFKVAFTITVDISGHGNFTTIQSAIDSIPSGNTKWIRIQIFAGVYRLKNK